MPAEPAAGEFYAKVIDEALQYERDRKAQLEQKALAIVTSSGVLVTLLFGFASVAKAGVGADVPVPARILLVVALGGFLVAAVVSIRVNRPVNYVPLGVEKDLRRMVTNELWNGSEDFARQSVAEFRVGEIDRWRDENGRKARLLQFAIFAQSCGVALLVMSIGLLLFQGTT